MIVIAVFAALMLATLALALFNTRGHRRERCPDHVPADWTRAWAEGTPG